VRAVECCALEHATYLRDRAMPKVKMRKPLLVGDGVMELDCERSFVRWRAKVESNGITTVVVLLQ
jgi:hypothetical protein